MPRSKKQPSEGKKPLDSVSGKRGRGRPQHIPREWVIGHADNYRNNLTEVWPRLAGPLLAAKTEGEVVSAFENYGQPYAINFVPARAADILAVMQDSTFPQRTEARIGYLSDSIAGDLPPVFGPVIS